MNLIPIELNTRTDNQKQREKKSKYDSTTTPQLGKYYLDKWDIDIQSSKTNKKEGRVLSLKDLLDLTPELHDSEKTHFDGDIERDNHNDNGDDSDNIKKNEIKNQHEIISDLSSLANSDQNLDDSFSVSSSKSQSSTSTLSASVASPSSLLSKRGFTLQDSPLIGESNENLNHTTPQVSRLNWSIFQDTQTQEDAIYWKHKAEYLEGKIELIKETFTQNLTGILSNHEDLAKRQQSLLEKLHSQLNIVTNDSKKLQQLLLKVMFLYFRI